MEEEKFFMNDGNTNPAAWNSSIFGMEIQANQLNCSSEQLQNCFFNPTWDNSMDQSDPFESALSSIVSSPANSTPGIPIPGSRGAESSIVLRELIGRLGSICHSGEISPQFYINGNNSTNTSCYNTPLNSPPKLNLSMMDPQMRGNVPMPIPGNLPRLSPFAADSGFAERAVRFSSFGGRISDQVGSKESEFYHRMESGNLSSVSSNQSFWVAAGSQLMDGVTAPDKKFSRLSRPSTPENTELGDSMEESSVSEQIPSGDIGMKGQSIDANARKRKSIPRGKAKDTSLTPSGKDAAKGGKDESNAKRSKSDEKAKEDDKAKGDGNQKQTKESAKPPEPRKDYIHVRARRGQATDSHSLAERVRREKISERMKFLQDLVPGCNKVTGKAVMLDEIINYVQSLQRQVEFLSMKLSTINPRMELSMEALLSKDVFQPRGSMPHISFPLDTAAQPFPCTFRSQHSENPNGTEYPFCMNTMTTAIHRNLSMKLTNIDGFSGPASQASAFWEDDLQSIVEMGLGQNQPQKYQGTTAIGQMKVEL